VTKVQLSVVIATYLRFETLKSCIESFRNHSGSVTLEFVIITSDPLLSQKNDWLRSQLDVTLIPLADRAPKSKRTTSLYRYENIGVFLAKGEWVLVINDDMRAESNLFREFVELRDQFDVLAIPTHLDNRKLGRRLPDIGTVGRHGQDVPLSLLDFAFIRRSRIIEVGLFDTNLDWFGKGVDCALSLALFTDAVFGRLQEGGLDHSISPEGRMPPLAWRDLHYLRKKWSAYSKHHPESKIEIPWSGPESRFIVEFGHRIIFPMLKFVRYRFSRIMSSKTKLKI
jgi:GT2 family glycosyltransferase